MILPCPPQGKSYLLSIWNRTMFSCPSADGRRKIVIEDSIRQERNKRILFYPKKEKKLILQKAFSQLYPAAFDGNHIEG